VPEDVHHIILIQTIIICPASMLDLL